MPTDLTGSASSTVAEILAKLEADPKTGLNPTLVRIGIVTLGFGIAAYYFLRIYGAGIHLVGSD